MSVLTSQTVFADDYLILKPTSTQVQQLLQVLDINGNAQVTIDKNGNMVLTKPLTVPSVISGGKYFVFPTTSSTTGVGNNITNTFTAQNDFTGAVQKFGTSLIANGKYQVFPSSSTNLVGNNITNTFTALQTFNSGITSTASSNSFGSSTFSGPLTMSGSDIILGGNKIKTSNFQFQEQNVIGNGGTVSITNQGANNNGQFAIYPTGTSRTSEIFLTRTSDITTNWESLLIGSDIQGSNEYDIQVSKSGSGSLRPLNLIEFGTYSAGMDTNANFGVYATKKLCLDFASGSCGNNYLVQSSANVDDLYSGGVNTLRSTSNSLTNYVDLNIGGNKIKTNTFSIYESAVSNLTFIPTTGNTNANYNFSPVGTATHVNALFYRSGFGTANNQALLIGSDSYVSGAYHIWSTTAGISAAIPINVVMQANNGGASTKLLSFDTANTITSYVNLQLSGASLSPQNSVGSGAFSMDVAGQTTVSLAQNAISTIFGGSNNFAGMFIIRDNINGDMALVGTSAGTVTITQQSGTSFTNTSTPSASQTGIYLNASVVTIKNGFATSHTYQVMSFRMIVGN